MSSSPTGTERARAARRGRPIAGTEPERRDHVLDAALAELIDTGADQLTMAAVARRAGASKETLYRWFGDREGLFAALIQRNADRSAHQIEQRLTLDGPVPTQADFHQTLVAYGSGLLGLLTGEVSVALNRAAMTDSRLRVLLLQQGRHRVGPLVERYLQLGDEIGALSLARVGDPATAFELLYGLVVRDTQIRVLLGESPPSASTVRERASEAVSQFLRLCTPID